MLFDIPYIANSNKIGDYRQHQTDLNNKNVKIKKCSNYDYKVCDKILIVKDGILRKAESPKKKEPWTITTIHTNGIIRVTRETKSEHLYVRRVEPFFEKA